MGEGGGGGSRKAYMFIFNLNYCKLESLECGDI